MAGAIVGWSVCAICRKPVDRVTYVRSPFPRQSEFVIECHGKKEIRKHVDFMWYQDGILSYRTKAEDET